MAKIRSERSQRLKAIFGILFAAFLLGLAGLGWQLTRPVDFSWEQANIVEANEARRKIKLLESGIESGKWGFVRLSQIEVNSYLLGTATNEPPSGRIKLTNVKVSLQHTNFTLVSFGELNLFGLPVRLALQRDFRIVQEGTNHWSFPLQEVRIGEVTIPRAGWPYVGQLAKRLDHPLASKLSWATNLPALRIAKNELSGDPELRLYTHKPLLD